MADEKSIGRISLEAFFQAGDIPEERHFSALIHSGINQIDDGLTKSSADPLRIQAPINRNGDSARLIELYEDRLDGEPNWRFLLRQDNRGLQINQGSSEGLFIAEDGGFVGIGTTTPSVALEVDGAVKAGSVIGTIQPESGRDKGLVFYGSPAKTDGNGPAAKMLFYERGNPGQGANLEIRVQGGAADHILLQPSGNVGVKTNAPTADLEVNGTAKATVFTGLIRPTAGNTDKNGILFPLDPGRGKFDAAWIRYYPRTGEHTTLEIGVSNDAQDHIALMPSGNVGIGTLAPEARLHVNGHIKAAGGLELAGELPGNAGLKLKLGNGFGLGRSATDLYFGAIGSHSWRDANLVDERMVLTTGAKGGLAVKGTGVSSIAGSLAVGRPAVTGNLTLEVKGHAGATSFQGQIRPTVGSSADAGIVFPRDPGGGGGDAAWIRYYPRSGEATTFEIGTSNDANDHIVLRPNNGNVGIGNGNFIPQHKLHVDGPVKASYFIGKFQPSSGNSADDGIVFPKDPGGSGDAGWIRYYARTGENTTLEIGISNDAQDHIALMPSGNVGIGTTDPVARLDVRGLAKATAFSGQLQPTSGSTNSDGILFPNDPGGGSGDRAWIRYYPRAGENTTLEIGVSNDAQDHIALMPSGNVGIGTTDPVAKLDVRGVARASSFVGPLRPTAGNTANDGILFPNDPGGGSGDAAWIRYYARAGENTTLEIGVSNDAQDHIALMPSGNVGVGTTGPEAKLDVNGKIIARNDIASTTGRYFGSEWNDYLELRAIDDSLRYFSNSNELFTVLNNGSVGIGYPDPQSRLHVAGELQALSFRIGNTIIGERELAILKKLADNQLEVKIVSRSGYVLDNYGDRVNDGDNDRTVQFQRDVGFIQTKMKLVIW